jgi:hypothetical protein
MFFVMMALQEGGLSLTEVIHSIPHDASAAFVYILMIVFVALIWAGSRKGTK